MPNNQSVTDIKPINQSVLDVKPNNLNVIDIKSLNFNVIDSTTVYSQPYSISPGMWIPFAGFTYANAFNGTTKRL